VRTAIVVGAGIGGLTTAAALKRIGWSPLVLEKSALLGEVGAGLSLAPNALAALDEIGIGQGIRAMGRPSEADGTMMQPSGHYLMKRDSDRDDRLLAFHRADLHRALREAVGEDSIRTATTVRGVAGVGDRVLVEHSSGSDVADLVVAADGIHSSIRTADWPGATPPVFRNYTVWRGIAALGGVAGSMTLAAGSYFLVHPLTGGRVYWALGTRAEVPGVTYTDDHAEVVARTVGWHDPVRRLLDATPPGAVIHNDIYDLDPLPTYVNGGVALLGDAAHAMCPDLGQGAGQAMEDAVVLAASLQAETDMASALRRYDIERRPRSQGIARDARKRATISTSTRKSTYSAMRLAMRLMPPAIAARASARVWNWSPPHLR
jgi:2-polyprenyl-6-methoxyphenol hydroxylase-like FAD-dependent oxidoreductase